jgi:ABC-type multidrug transport system fused ATPase/permease subunit
LTHSQAIIYFFIAHKYLKSSRELKRLESVTRSPIFSHFGEALQGASTIRAYNAEKRFLEENYQRVDTNHRAFFYLWVSNRWLSVRVDFVGALVTFSTSFAIILFSRIGIHLDAGISGISLSYALAFTDALLWIVRMHALMEMEMNAVERVGEYLDIEQEFPAVIESSRPQTNASFLILNF